MVASDLQNYTLSDKKSSRNKLFTFPQKKIATDSACIIFWNLPSFAKKLDLSALPKEKMVLFLWEPPAVNSYLYKEKLHRLFSRIYTWDDDLVDNKRYFKFFYPNFHPMEKQLPSFQERKLCTLIAANKSSRHPDELYSLRDAAIAYFEAAAKDEFTLYGYGWEEKNYSCYKGAVNDKIQTLKQYRFALCYENISGLKGYITEKIFDCFRAAAIPIYLGAVNVEEYIPKECFIDRRDFSSNEELLSYLHSFTEEEYNRRILATRNFLDSAAARRFSKEEFLKLFLDLISTSDQPNE